MDETRNARAAPRVVVPKPDEGAKEYFRSLLPGDARVQVRPMFGNLAAFVNGQMFLGLYGNDVFVRLPEADRGSIMREGGGTLEPMPGRPMREYVTLPPTWRSEPGRAEEWVSRALEYAASLPPKGSARKAKADPA
jgi:TfoX/Sxy family transcriptional regulator of competence genes